MSNFKLPSTISTEDLLKELSDSKTIVNKKVKVAPQSHIYKFLEVFHIEPGAYSIDKKILYNLFRQFERIVNPNTPVVHRIFYARLKNFLKLSNNMFYINQKSLDLSEKVVGLLNPKKRDGTKTIPLQAHFQNFLKKYNIKPCKTNKSIWVTTSSLYELYSEWSLSIRKKRPLNLLKFNQFCRIYFPAFKKDSFSKTWISLDESITPFITSRMTNGKEKKEPPK